MNVTCRRNLEGRILIGSPLSFCATRRTVRIGHITTNQVIGRKPQTMSRNQPKSQRIKCARGHNHNNQDQVDACESRFQKREALRLSKVETEEDTDKDISLTKS